MERVMQKKETEKNMFRNTIIFQNNNNKKKFHVGVNIVFSKYYLYDHCDAQTMSWSWKEWTQRMKQKNVFRNTVIFQNNNNKIINVFSCYTHSKFLSILNLLTCYCGLSCHAFQWHEDGEKQSTCLRDSFQNELEQVDYFRCINVFL